MRASHTARAVAVVCCGAVVGACSWLVDGSGYEERALASGLAPLGDACASCLERSCRYAFETCAKKEACVERALCRGEHIDPSGHWTCGGFDQDIDDLLRCSACRDECGWGRQMGCVGRYVWPRPKTDVVRFRQRLLDTLETSKPLRGVKAQACASLALDCEGSVIAEATTDAQGWYELTLPVQDTPAPRAAGFRGIIRLTGETTPTYQLQLASPIFTDSEDTLHVFDNTSLALVSLFGPSILPGKGHVLFQIFDCMRTGAEGIRVEVGPPSTERSPLYLKDVAGAEFVADTGTWNAGDGIGSVLNLEPEPALYTFTFREMATGNEYARVNVSLAADEISVLHVDPGPSDEVLPW